MVSVFAKSSIVVSLLLSCALGFYAQQARALWSDLEPAGEEFFVSVPVEMTKEGDPGPKFSRSYRGEIGGAYLYVFSDPIKAASHASSVARYAKAWGQTLDVKGSEQRLAFQDPFGYWQNLVLLRSKSRLYIGQTVSSDKNDAIAQRFISSFKLSSTLPEETANEEVQETPPMEVLPPVSPITPGDLGPGTGTGTGSGGGTGGGGLGSGSGIGSGHVLPPAPLAPSPVPGKTAALKIISKPRPAYTDAARFYEISGTVSLRVTFLESGQIGPVMALTKLPFGLTEQAVNAARKMTFQPAQRNGVLIPATRAVDYNFFIY